jgi:hypothetical protein
MIVPLVLASAAAEYLVRPSGQWGTAVYAALLLVFVLVVHRFFFVPNMGIIRVKEKNIGQT